MAGGYCCLGLGGKAHGSRVRDFHSRSVFGLLLFILAIIVTLHYFGQEL
jgi:hypothetical protein